MTDKSYAEQLASLFKQLQTELTIDIVLGLQAHDKPKDEENGGTKYPFIGYNILSQTRVAHLERFEMPEDEESNIVVPDGEGEEQLEEPEEPTQPDFKRIVEEQHEITISFVGVATNPYDAIETAKKVYDWLENDGRYFLTTNEIVHVSSTPISSRDFFMVNDYERRAGFDCRLRLGRVVEQVMPRIEIVEMPDGNILNKQGG